MNEPVSQKQWYVNAFGDSYRLRYPHRTDEAARDEIQTLLKTIDLTPPAQVADVCCGNGRHLAALIELGFDGVGLDLSPELLDAAAQRPGLSDRLIRADVRHLPLESDYDLVVNLFTSIGYFSEDQDNQQAVHEIVRLARPGGSIVIDHAHAAYVRSSLVPHDVVEREGMRIENHRQLVGKRVEKKTIMTDESGERQELFESVRLFDPDELCQWMADAGTSTVRLCGDFDGRPLDDDSARMIAIGVKS